MRTPSFPRAAALAATFTLVTEPGPALCPL